MRTLFTRIILLLTPLLFFACGGGSGGDDSSDGDLGGATICLNLGINAKVINGQVCSNARSPIVKIELTNRDGTGGICTGNVVGPRKILTAAHCFIFTDVVGAVVDVDGRKIPVTSTVLHPGVGTDGVNLALFNDVAVVTTAVPLGVSTIGIVLSQSAEVGDAIGVQGFGLDENGDFGTPKGGAMIVSGNTPNHIFAEFNGNGANPCNGDSGGPATLTLVDGSVGIVGTVSSGNPTTECFEGDVTLFTNLQNSEVLDFILGQVPGIATL